MVNGEWSATGPARVRPDAICRVRLGPVVWGLIFLSLACHSPLNQSPRVDGFVKPMPAEMACSCGEARCGPRDRRR
jgi:hypothetical protein